MLLSVVLVLSVIVPVAAEDISKSGNSGSSRVTLDLSARNLRVTVPSVLPIDVDSDNNVTVATNASINNLSDGPVEVTNVAVDAKNGWTIVPFATDFTKVPVDTKQFGMTMYDDDVADGVPASLFDVIKGSSQLPVRYDGTVAIQSSTIHHLDIGHVVFTVAWSEADGPVVQNYTYNVENADVQAFLATPAYNSSDYTYTNVPSRYTNDRPILRNLPNTETMTLPEGSATITFTDSSVNKTWTEQVSGDTYILKNFIPNRTYSYSVKNSSGAVVKSGYITPTGQVRMIDGGGVTSNIRDLGGWGADGGSLKYGVLYRSGELDGYNKNGNVGLTDTQKTYFKNNLGISYEVDLQADNEIDGDNISALGNDVDYSHWAINYYITNFYLIDYPNSKIVGALRTIAQNLQNGNVGVLHCTEGADRTATVAFILEALCGVSESDIDRDYELTSFGQNTKTRNGDNWTQMKSFIKENYSGNTLRDKVINFLEKAGITYEEMNIIRNALIDGTPETIGDATNTWSENKFSASTATLASRIKSDTSVTAHQDGWVVSDFIPVDEYKEVMLKTDRLGDFYGTWFGVAFYNENKERISTNNYTQGIENTNITTSSENMTATFLSKRLVDYRGKYMRIYMSYTDLNNVEIKLR